MSWTIIITRPAADSARLAELFAREGVLSLPFPLVEVRGVPMSDALRRKLQRLGDGAFGALILTSANAVRMLSLMQKEIGSEPLPAAVRLFAVGSATAKSCVAEWGREPDVIGPGTGKELAREVIAAQLAGRVLYPCAVETVGAVEQELEAAGVAFVRLPIYETCKIHPPEEWTRRLADLDPAKSVAAFFSPSAVRAAVELCGPALFGRRLAAIGPTTSDALRSAGLESAFEPSAPDNETFVRELCGRMREWEREASFSS